MIGILGICAQQEARVYLLSGTGKQISSFLGQLLGLSIFKDHLRAEILAESLSSVLQQDKCSI